MASAQLSRTRLHRVCTRGHIHVCNNTMADSAAILGTSLARRANATAAMPKQKAGRGAAARKAPSEAPPAAAATPPSATMPKPAVSAAEQAEVALRAAISGDGLSVLEAALTPAARTPAGGDGAVEPTLQRPTAKEARQAEVAILQAEVAAQQARQAEVAAAEVVREQKPPVPAASQSAEHEKPVISAEEAPAAAGSVGQVPPRFYLL